MKKKNRKGFTIVELVIVIAVIGILAAVLIPTFSSMIDNANESKALQEARNIYTEYLIQEDGQIEETTIAIKVTVNNTPYYFTITNGTIDIDPDTTAPENVTIIVKNANGTIGEGE